MRFRSGMTAGVLGALVATLSVGCGAHPPSPAPPPPAALPASVAVTAAPVGPDPLVGAVFLGGMDLHTCTASVLHSATGNLILTAAHCLADGYPATFAPGFDGQAGSAGIWTIDAVYLDPRWLATQDPLADFAIARVSRDGSGSVEELTGRGLTLGNAPASGAKVAVVGYPVGVGGAPIGCSAETTTTADGFPAVRCAGLVAGTSGAPWRTDSTVVGVIGGLDGGGCEEKISYAPPFDGRVADLLRRAEAGGPGDAAPEGFDGDC